MWELDCEEGWALKNWCWIVVLEKTLERPLDCKVIQPVHSKGNQSWDFFGGNDAKAEPPIVWPPHAKCWLIGKDSDTAKDWEQEEKGMMEDKIAGWHHRLDAHVFGWTLGVRDGQGGLAPCDSWGRKESDTSERLKWLTAWSTRQQAEEWVRRTVVFTLSYHVVRVVLANIKTICNLSSLRASLGAQTINNPPAVQETQVRFLG